MVQFENDVKIYGIQTDKFKKAFGEEFENDVKIYGIQTHAPSLLLSICLRMM